MRFRVVFAPEAHEDFSSLSARARAEVRDAINRHLVHQPTQVSRSRIKRLRGARQPQYRLRVGDVRVFYDVRDDEVDVLAIVEKPEAADWLKRTGVFDEESCTG
ncbi:MAG: type II toxin-antitoxin system RelE/ParE family toxin [candidate division WOR-3 bacterium]|nr:MAG: type II toxin-antitoxin system RelE/ParE family toxin [candidate division WOR-3 bacterium]